MSIIKSFLQTATRQPAAFQYQNHASNQLGQDNSMPQQIQQPYFRPEQHQTHQFQKLFGLLNQGSSEFYPQSSLSRKIIQNQAKENLIASQIEEQRLRFILSQQ